MEIPQATLDRFNLASSITTLAVTRINPCYEIAKLFVTELNKTAGQEYVTKAGKKGKSIFYTEILVMKDLKKLKISDDVHKANGFYSECEKSSLGFRFYYKCQLKKIK